ncbi:protein of unknown function (plasmid) [Candidatus Methylocalor cossyra]|uniref:Uncharacterized protein n=1 Tax=Candidatus Methylocalor cossyra TaxID=3108543 RepID=A0ABM9NMY0_9GAMM
MEKVGAVNHPGFGDGANFLEASRPAGGYDVAPEVRLKTRGFHGQFKRANQAATSSAGSAAVNAGTGLDLRNRSSRFGSGSVLGA